MIFFLALCLLVLVWDVLFLCVPNRLLLLALALHTGCLLLTGHGLGGADVWQSLIGGVIALGLFLPLYALRAMGAGDVKFFALLGLILGSAHLIPLWLISGALAGLHAITFYLYRREVPMLPFWLFRLMQRLSDSAVCRKIVQGRQGRQGIPYAAYLAVAAICSTMYRRL